MQLNYEVKHNKTHFTNVSLLKEKSCLKNSSQLASFSDKHNKLSYRRIVVLYTVLIITFTMLKNKFE